MTCQGPVGLEFFSTEAHVDILLSAHCSSSSRDVLAAGSGRQAVLADRRWVRKNTPGSIARPLRGGGIAGRELTLQTFGAKLVLANLENMPLEAGDFLRQPGDRVGIGLCDAGTIERVLPGRCGSIVRLDNGERWLARPRSLLRTRVFLDY